LHDYPPAAAPIAAPPVPAEGMPIMGFKLIRREDVEPHEDYGFFGPGSVTWKVWSYPTSISIGFSRAVTIEELDPALIAAVVDSGGVRERTRSRYDRTLRYFALVKFGDTRTAMTASNMLVKVHAKAVGTEPLSGNRYDANHPHSQLWIHLTAWHSILYAYERYGPGKLSPEEEARYWEECAIAAELQTCDPADIPRTREGVREYFEYMRGRIAGSEQAQEMMDFLLNVQEVIPSSSPLLRPVVWGVNKAHRIAIIATMPRWMRRMAGLRQSRVADALIVPVIRATYRLANANKHLLLALLGTVSPSTVPIAAPVLLNVPPKRRETLTPAQARERYGILPPSEEYARFRALVEAQQVAREDVQVGPEREDSIALLGPVTAAA
jgi:uncharacterized protein (DUF2236 family)